MIFGRMSQAIFDKAVEVSYGGQRRIEWQEFLAGKKAFDKTGEVVTEQETLEAIRESLVAIKGPLETPVGGGIRSLNVALRQELDLLRLCSTGSVLRRSSKSA